MNYEPKTTKDSATLPGVRFTISEISEGHRRRLRRELAPAFAQIADIETEREEFYQRISERLGKPAVDIKLDELTPRERREFVHLNERIDEINDCEVNPAYFRAGFVSVEGLAVGDKSAFAADELVEIGPPALAREITRAILGTSELDATEKANLSSPSTSTAAAEGQTSGTSARSASDADGSVTATADAFPAA